MIPPDDDPRIIAGQGTVGLEILEQAPEVTTIVVPVGGGGLASGIATAARTMISRKVRVVGVEPELAAEAAESLRVGELVTWPAESTQGTMAVGVRAGISGLAFSHMCTRLYRLYSV